MSGKENENATKVAHYLMKALLQAGSFEGPLSEYLKQTPEANGVPPPPLELPFDKTKPTLDLPKPEELRVKPVDLRYAIENRRSIRSYSAEELSLEELSWLLWCTQGVKELRKDRPVTLRTVPSGGSRHPFETYLLLNRVKGITPGLYRFLALEHRLLQMRTGLGLSEEIAHACGCQQFIENSAAVFLWSFVPMRSSWRFGAKAYKVLLEVGHVCQNLYLGAEAVDCGACAIAAYDLEEVHRILDIQDDDQYIVYVATVGKKITS
jgi:SagB-type dehydrogenase family enzyme